MADTGKTPTEEEIVKYFDNIVVKTQDGCVYYQDAKKKWKHYTTAEGYQLLLDLLRLTHKTMVYCTDEMTKAGMDVEAELEKGKEVYTEKPSRQTEAITWSQQDYATLGLQYHYLRLKSIQRFTETYNMMHRAYNKGIFQGLEKEKEVCSSEVPFLQNLFSLD